MSMAALPHRCRDGGGGAAAADFLQNHRGSGAAAAGFLKFIAVAAWQRQIFQKFIAVAAEFFLRTSKKCMNLIEFQCLHVKHPETE
jgi:hypothetical protein